jgi:hypothetical protein
MKLRELIALPVATLIFAFYLTSALAFAMRRYQRRATPQKGLKEER